MAFAQTERCGGRQAQVGATSAPEAPPQLAWQDRPGAAQLVSQPYLQAWVYWGHTGEAHLRGSHLTRTGQLGPLEPKEFPSWV